MANDAKFHALQDLKAAYQEAYDKAEKARKAEKRTQVSELNEVELRNSYLMLAKGFAGLKDNTESIEVNFESRLSAADEKLSEITKMLAELEDER